MKKGLIVLLLCALVLTAACGQVADTASSTPEETAAVQTGLAEAPTPETEATDAVTTPAETTAPAAPSASEETAAQTTEDDTPALVSVHWADAVPQDLLRAQQYTAIDDESGTLILFKTNRTVRDFRFLGLELDDVDEDRNISFRCETLVELDALAPGQPAAVRTVFWGDIPNNGFSFVDENGQTQCYSVSISGRDGSLVTEPFVPA